MTIEVNGDRTDLEPGETVAALLARHRLVADRVVVELNREILRGTDLSTVRLSEGDRVEIVRFVGGG